VGIDLAFGALAGRTNTGEPFLHLAADVEHLPFRPQTFRGAIAASVLQWLDSPAAALSEIAAVLKPSGRLIFSVFVEGSFAELSATRALYGLPSPVRCPSPGDFEVSLRAAGFDHISYEPVTHTVFAADAKANLKSINAIGGTGTEGPSLTRGKLADFCRSYEERFRTENGVPLTYKAIVGICKKGL
jgi:SAM-dependent methyltransferase